MTMARCAAIRWPRRVRGSGDEQTPDLANLIGRDGVVNVVRDVGLKRALRRPGIAARDQRGSTDIEAYLRPVEQIPSLRWARGNDECRRPGAVRRRRAVAEAPRVPARNSGRPAEAQHSLRGGDLFDRLNAGPATPGAGAASCQPACRRHRVQDERPLVFRLPLRPRPHRGHDRRQSPEAIDR